MPTKIKTDKLLTINESEVVEREASEQEKALLKREVLLPVFGQKQLLELSMETPEYAIKTRVGKAGMMYRYVSHGYVTDRLNKIFGYDWDVIIDEISEGQRYEIKTEVVKDKKGNDVENRYVAVVGRLIVRVRKPKTLELVTSIEKSGFGSQQWLPGMEFGDALKAARSDLVKTCAFQLGIALDLYYNDEAEFENYLVEKERKIEQERELEKLRKSMSGEPVTGVSLLSTALERYNISAEIIQEKYGYNPATILSMPEEEITKLWEEIESDNAWH